MKTLMFPMLFASALALGGCGKNADTTNTAAPTPAPVAPTAADATAEDAAAATNSMAGMSAEEHAAMEAAADAHHDADAASGGTKTGAMPSGMQAGWYMTGTFRTCGSAHAMKVDKPTAIDEQIKKGGMSASDPVYVQLEGMPMGDAYMLTRIAQVGAKTPVRDCPMTGSTTQQGG